MSSRRVDIGDLAPDVKVRTEQGERIALSSLRGSPAVVAFFSAEWDPARPHQLALYNQALARLPGGGRLVSIAEQGSVIEANLQGEGRISFPLVREEDVEGHAATAFGVTGEDTVFVLDSEGLVRWRFSGRPGSLPPIDELVGRLSRPGEGVSRRELLGTAIAAMVAMTLIPRSAFGSAPSAGASRASIPGEHVISLDINGQSHRVALDPRVSLLDALRERLGLSGTKKGCDHGQCGACTVHMDGRRVNSCLVLAVQAEGSKIVTIEGLAHGDQLHPVQEAFITHDGFQCGYCTPGQIMSAVACIQEGHANDEGQIKEWMSGNICRCGAYPGICEAIKEAKGRMAVSQ